MRDKLIAVGLIILLVALLFVIESLTGGTTEVVEATVTPIKGNAGAEDVQATPSPTTRKPPGSFSQQSGGSSSGV